MDTIDVAIPTSLYVYERVNSVRWLRLMLLKYELKSKSYPELQLNVSTEMKIALSWYVHLKINFLRFTDAQVRKYFFYVVRKRPRDFIMKQSDVDDDTLVSDAVEGLIACRTYRRFM